MSQNKSRWSNFDSNKYVVTSKQRCKPSNPPDTFNINLQTHGAHILSEYSTLHIVIVIHSNWIFHIVLIVSWLEFISSKLHLEDLAWKNADFESQENFFRPGWQKQCKNQLWVNGVEVYSSFFFLIWKHIFVEKKMWGLRHEMSGTTAKKVSSP